MPQPTHPDIPIPSGKVWLRILALPGFTLLVGTALILSQRIPARVSYDQKLYHEPTARTFAAQWPHLDFWNYLSATTPGYHVLLAAVAKLISPSTMALQFTSLAVAVALTALLGLAVARRLNPLIALAVCMPFACSMYTIQSSAWLLPDNIGWLGVLGVLLIALRDRPTTRWMMAGGVVLAALVMVRQIHLWTAGLLWVSAWLPPEDVYDDRTPAREFRFWNPRVQIPRTLFAIVCTLPACAVLALFARYWGGLVPPSFQGWYHGVNESACVLVLATFGALSPFFAFTWFRGLRGLWLAERGLLIRVVVAALALFLILPTDPNYEAGRRTGLWNIAAKFPVIANHSSPVMIALALLGVIACISFTAMAHRRARLTLLAAVIGFSLACTANHDLFQRYVDPFVLMLLALMAARAQFSPPRAWREAIGPITLALILLCVALAPVINNPDRISDPPPPAMLPGEKVVPPAAPQFVAPTKPPGKHFWPW